MKSTEISPPRKEFQFLIKLFTILIGSLIISFIILFVFLNKNLGSSYPNAFQVVSGLVNKLNFYFLFTVFIQLLFSSILLFIVTLLFSQKIAGPMFRLKRVLRLYGEGVRMDKISFRQADFLPGVSEWFSDFFTFLKKRKDLLEEAETLLAQLDTETEENRKAIIEKIQALITELDRSDAA